MPTGHCASTEFDSQCLQGNSPSPWGRVKVTHFSLLVAPSQLPPSLLTSCNALADRRLDLTGRHDSDRPTRLTAHSFASEGLRRERLPPLLSSGHTAFLGRRRTAHKTLRPSGVLLGFPRPSGSNPLEPFSWSPPQRSSLDQSAISGRRRLARKSRRPSGCPGLGGSIPPGPLCVSTPQVCSVLMR